MTRNTHNSILQFLGLTNNAPTDVFGVSIGIYTILDLREATFLVLYV